MNCRCLPAVIILAAATPTTAGLIPDAGQTQTAMPVTITGAAVAGLEPFDELMTSFLSLHQIPGAAVCVSRNGHIIYDRGFGTADVEACAPVEPTSRFRIASVSKPITAVAILMLVERGPLALDDNPFVVIGRQDALDREGTDPRLNDVTIRQVLQHTAGWDRGKSFDPMFQYRRISQAMNVPSPPSQEAIIDFMMQQPLDADPGSAYAYSNFGYCVLGRVIEAVSGQSYEAFVRENVLAPIGVTEMTIGRSLPEDRAAREVVYYDATEREGIPIEDPTRMVPRPYVIDHDVMDAHGAWIATASDIVRFADAFNDRERSPLLSHASIEMMFAPPQGTIGHKADGSVRAFYYGCGWSVRPAGMSANTWHMGQINGTSTLLVRRHDGLNWAVLFNTDACANADRAPAFEIDGLMHRAAAQVSAWPSAENR